MPKFWQVRSARSQNPFTFWVVCKRVQQVFQSEMRMSPLGGFPICDIKNQFKWCTEHTNPFVNRESQKLTVLFDVSLQRKSFISFVNDPKTGNFTVRVPTRPYELRFRSKSTRTNFRAFLRDLCIKFWKLGFFIEKKIDFSVFQIFGKNFHFPNMI